MRGSPPPPAPTPCVGVRSILVHAFDPPLQDIFLHTPMHTCMTYAMYISLQPYVGRRIRGKCGMPPPPPRLDLFTCMHYAFEPHLKIPGHANEYMSVIAWSTIVGRQIRGIRGASPRRISIRVHAFEPHFKIPGYICQCIRISYTTYIGLDFRSTNKWGEPPPPCGLRTVEPWICYIRYAYVTVSF